VADAGLGQIQCSLVLGAHRGIEEPSVTKAHLGRDVPEQGHERLERYSGVDHHGGKGVAELMRRDVSDARDLRGAIEFQAQRLLSQAPAVVGEEELRGSSTSRVRKRSALGACRGDSIDQGDGLVVQGHHPLGIQLAQRNLEPRSVAGNFVHAIELEIEELTNAQPAGSGQ